jgi:uncharacterized membrane protein
MPVKTPTKAQKKQMMTGWLLLVVGISAMLVGWFATTNDFWRGATFGVGLAAVLVSSSYLFPKYVK